MRELEKVIIIRYSDIDSIVKYDFGNNNFEIVEYIDCVHNGTYKLYENIGDECKSKKDDVNFERFMEKMGHFLQTNDEKGIEEETGYCGVMVEWILECLVYNKCLMPGNYLIDVSW
jgi:hypothetical protein